MDKHKYIVSWRDKHKRPKIIFEPTMDKVQIKLCKRLKRIDKRIVRDIDKYLEQFKDINDETIELILHATFTFDLINKYEKSLKKFYKYIEFRKLDQNIYN